MGKFSYNIVRKPVERHSNGSGRTSSAGGNSAPAVHDHAGQLLRPATLVIPQSEPSGLYSEEWALFLGTGAFGEEPGAGGLDIDALWQELTGQDSTKKIDISHLPAIGVGDIGGLQAALDGKAALKHFHAIADVTGLREELNALISGMAGKADTGHGHSVADIQDFPVKWPWNDISGKPETFAPAAHQHPWSQIVSRPDTLSGYGIKDAYTKDYMDAELAKKASSVHDHAGQLLRPATLVIPQSEPSGLYSGEWALFLGTGAFGENPGAGGLDIDALWQELTGQDSTKKIDISHIPALGVSNIDGLQAALDGKAALKHFHSISDVTGLQDNLYGLMEGISSKADKATTLAGYGITDAYTKTESDGKYALKTSLSNYLPLAGGRMAKDAGIKWTGIISDANVGRDSGLKISYLGGGSYQNYPINYGTLLSVMPTYYGFQLFSYPTADRLYFRRQSTYTGEENYSDWRQIAFKDSDISGNAATATKLATPVKLWGKDFDGSKAITGNMTNVGSIEMNWIGSEMYMKIHGTGSLSFNTVKSGGWARAYNVYDNAFENVIGTIAGAYGYGETLAYTYYGGGYANPYMRIMPDGKVGIGKSPEELLDVNGNIRATLLNLPKTSGSATDKSYGINIGSVGHIGVSTLLGIYSTGKVAIRPNGGNTTNQGIDLTTDSFTYNGKTVYHSGNSNKSDIDWNAKNLISYGYLSFGQSGAQFAEDIRETFRTSMFGNANNGSRFVTVRTNATISKFSEIYGSAIAWATNDTHGYLGVSYSSKKAFIAGGSSGKINWNEELYHTGNANNTNIDWTARVLRSKTLVIPQTTPTGLQTGEMALYCGEGSFGEEPGAGGLDIVAMWSELSKSDTSKKIDISHIPALGVSNISGLQEALDGKASKSHNHTIAGITGLQTELYGLMEGISSKADKDGANATGTWGIGITGNAATATKIKDYANTQQTIAVGWAGDSVSTTTHFAVYTDGAAATKCIKDMSVPTVKALLEKQGGWKTGLGCTDKRGEVTTPNDYSKIMKFVGLKYNTTIGLSKGTGTYSYLLGLRGWSDNSGGMAWEMAFNNGGIFARRGATDTWDDWGKLAFTNSDITGNAATATKLATPVSLWGNSFDGSNGISGSINLANGASINLSSYGVRKYKVYGTNTEFDITADPGGWIVGNYIKHTETENSAISGAYGGNGYFQYLFYGGTPENPHLRILTDGKVGIRKNPTEMLDINGNIKAYRLVLSTGTGVGSDNPSQIWFRLNDATYPMVIQEDSVRRGASRPNATLGDSVYRWKNVYAVDGNFSGEITATNFIGNLTGRADRALGAYSSQIQGNTIGELKTKLLEQANSIYGNKALSVINTTKNSAAAVMGKWNDDTYSLVAGSRTQFIRLDTYTNDKYGAWLVSGYGTDGLYYLGLSTGKWYGPYVLYHSGNVNHPNANWTAKSFILGNGSQIYTDNSTNILAMTSEGSVPLSINPTEVRRGRGTPNVNLGSATYPWNKLYASIVDTSYVADGAKNYYVGRASSGIGSSATGMLILAYGANPIHFYTNSSRRMIITGDGMIGINTPSPTERLDVNGNLRSRGDIKADGTISEGGKSLSAKYAALNGSQQQDFNAAKLYASIIYEAGAKISEKYAAINGSVVQNFAAALLTVNDRLICHGDAVMSGDITCDGTLDANQLVVPSTAPTVVKPGKWYLYIN